MPSVVAEIGPVVQWKGETFRLIPSRFPPVSVYEGLVANDRLNALVDIENLTNPRLQSQARIANLENKDPKTSARLQNWNLAPFAYGHPDGSTFFDADRPCLEVAADRQTALAISVAKRQRFLACTSEGPIGLDMRMFKTPLSGRFVDLRCLDAEEARDRGRELGKSIGDDVDGVLFHPIERPSATAISVLNGSTLEQTLQAAHYRYQWNGERISLLYAFDDIGTRIEPEHLRSEADCLAA
jgi:hypothetical protein